MTKTREISGAKKRIHRGATQNKEMIYTTLDTAFVGEEESGEGGGNAMVYQSGAIQSMLFE